MSINVNKIKVPDYYHREYKNDVSKIEEVEPVKEKTLVEDLQRIGMVSLPFISLYKPISFPLSLAMGGLRIFSSTAELISTIQQGDIKAIGHQAMQTTVAVIALAGTVLAHPLGMLITTSHDLLIELYHLLNNLHEGKYEQAVLSCANIVNNVLYLGLFLHGGLELGIASLTVQMCIGFYHSYDEFKNGNNLEGAGHILMGLIRSRQLSTQIEMLEWKSKIKAVTGNVLGTALVIQKEDGNRSLAIGENEIPKEVLEIYRKFRGADFKAIIPNASNEEISLLLKYHLYRPDFSGECCKLLFEEGPKRKPPTLELVQMCLPDRTFLVENPMYIYELYKKALKHQIPEVLSFLANREIVKDCQIRDEYFLSWYQHEMQKAGAFAGEYLEDFVKRKNYSAPEIHLLISKMPLEVQRVCPRDSQGYCYSKLWGLHSFQQSRL